MMTTVFIATSLDGYIAREDGGIDWLPMGADGDEDYGYTALMSNVDALVMGRNTFELVLGFRGAWPYGSKRVVVLTSRPLELPPRVPDTVEVMSGAPHDVVRQLAGRGIASIYVDGGNTIQRFLAEGLIRRLVITRIPVLLGRGIPLFGRLEHDVPLTHVRTTSYPSGLVQDEYAIPPGPASSD